ncbi:MAG: prepilin-type N-terminal cleavage/methylation domain-containing protein [Sedimentisphaerales bacterium]|nr:prepilin-type N-terminal cleavage/methylation domain-containing protein [Sedimentisphaerales bacterium]
MSISVFTPQKKKAFTLIELLVVISIIALLISILVPALSIARQQATGAVCLINQKNLLTTWLMYADDNKDLIVSSFTGELANIPGWVDSPTANTLQAKKEAIERGALYKYVNDVQVYHCPGDKRDINSVSTAYRTYSIANCMNGEDRLNNPSWPFESQYIGGGVCTRKVSSIKNATEKYVFVEEMDSHGYNAGSWGMNIINPQWIDPLAIWHNDSSTLAFADGHSEMHSWKQDPVLIEMCEWAKKGDFDNSHWRYTTADNPAWLYMKRGWNVKY